MSGFEITHFKSALHELPEFDQDFDEDDASTEEIPKEGDDVPF